jgi:glyoxylase-like metal-dependent hydrolase (beta-lactamase superfamily II)
LTTSPSVGIGQRGILIQTEAGNLLWEPPGFYNEEMFEAIEKLGGVAAITASHPHLTGASVSMSHRFGSVPVYWNRDDQRWIRRPDDVIQLWQDTQEILPGVTLYQCGGHFAGSSVLHWPAGAGGRGILLTGDTMMVGSDRATVTFLRSFPNRIPLPERTIRRIASTVAPLAFDRLYSGFDPGLIATNASEAVQYSANRYIGWINDELRDPDDRFV